MFKKYLIIASKLDKAGINITTQLSQFGDYDFYLVEGEVLYEENLDLEKINRYDFVIFASKHQSEKKTKTLSIHAPGNLRNAELGGKNKKLSSTSALFSKQLYEKLIKNRDKFNLNNYQVTLECTHHGPLIDKPCIFIEIGSTEFEWKDRKAGFVIAKTISEIIEEFKENPYNEIAVAIGGPHYCPNFNKIQKNTNVAIGHVIPQYQLPLTEEMIQETIKKTYEPVDFVLLDWKGLGNSEQRKQVLEILDKLYINYEKTSTINKR